MKQTIETISEQQAFLDAKNKALDEFTTDLAYKYLDKQKEEQRHGEIRELLNKLRPYILSGFLPRSEILRFVDLTLPIKETK